MRHALSAVVLAIAAADVSAQSVNIDFGHSNPNATPPPSSAFAGAAGQPGNWMNVPTNLSPVQIDGLDALPSGITLTRTAGNITTFSVNNANTTGEFEALLDDFHGFSSVTTVVYQFTGVDPGAYTLFTYAIAPDNASFRTVVSVSGSSSTNPQVVGGSMPVNAFIPGVTHAVHDIIVGPDTTITITLQGNATAGSVNGFQLRQGNVELDASIQSPGAFACGCSPINFIGTANGPGGITGYTLEYASSSAGPWAEIGSGANPVVNASLASWNTTALPEGHYLIRLTVNGVGGDTNVGLSAVHVDRQAPVASYSTISPGAVLGGLVSVQGTASDRCFTGYVLQFSLAGMNSFGPVDPGSPNYVNQVTNSQLGAWDTTTIANGAYDLRVRTADSCGVQTTTTTGVVVDNQSPTATITQPSSTVDICGFVNIIGSALDDNLDLWRLEYTRAGSSTWTQLTAGNANINGTLWSWDTTGLPRGAYTLRLTAIDRATDLRPGGLNGHTTTYLRTINIGRAADINNDGIVNSADLSVFLAAFGSTCL